MNANELEDILENHKRWLSGEGGKRANLRGADLTDADLTRADLTRADLTRADLTRADLSDANLTDADLSGANLRGANLSGAKWWMTQAQAAGHEASLRTLNTNAEPVQFYNHDPDALGAPQQNGGADLSGADLSGADLIGTKLDGTIGNMKEIKNILIDTWSITYTSECLQIGCQRHRIDDWWAFTDDEISRMDKNALEWWGKHKEFIKRAIELSPALSTNYKEDIIQ